VNWAELAPNDDNLLFDRPGLELTPLTVLPFSGKTFVLTGTLATMTREQAKEKT